MEDELNDLFDLISEDNHITKSMVKHIRESEMDNHHYFWIFKDTETNKFYVFIHKERKEDSALNTLSMNTDIPKERFKFLHKHHYNTTCIGVF